MRQELDDFLCQRYPDLFIDRHADRTMTGMCWGFCCDDGWFDLIDGLCAAITAQIAAGISPPVVARQVKEKAGRLHFRFRGGNEETRRLVRDAEDRSEKICETCGRATKRLSDTHFAQCAKCLVGTPDA